MFQSSRIIVHSKKINITCEVCNFVARDYEDIECIEKNGSCTECYGNFAFNDMEAWLANKKPSSELARKKMGIHNYKTVDDGGLK